MVMAITRLGMSLFENVMFLLMRCPFWKVNGLFLQRLRGLVCSRLKMIRSGSWSESRARDVAPAAVISMLILFVSCKFWFENGVCFYTWAWLNICFGIVARVGTCWFEMLCFTHEYG